MLITYETVHCCWLLTVMWFGRYSTAAVHIPSCRSLSTNYKKVHSMKICVLCLLDQDRQVPYLTLLLLLLLSWRARQALPIWGDKNTPKIWGIPPDSKSRRIRLSLVIVDSHFIDWGTTQGRLSLPAADVLSAVCEIYKPVFIHAWWVKCRINTNMFGRRWTECECG